jgi:hypothetical protein
VRVQPERDRSGSERNGGEVTVNGPAARCHGRRCAFPWRHRASLRERSWRGRCAAQAAPPRASPAKIPDSVQGAAPMPASRPSGRRNFSTTELRRSTRLGHLHHLRALAGKVLCSACRIGQKYLERPQPSVHICCQSIGHIVRDIDKGKPPARGGRKATGLTESAGPPKRSERSALHLAARPWWVEGGTCARGGDGAGLQRSSRVWERRS